MSNISLLFADGTTLAVEQVALPLAITVLCEDFTALSETWEMFLDTDKLETMEVLTDETVTATFGGLTLTSTQTVYNNDGSMTAHFYLDYAQSGDEVTASAALEEILEVLSDDEE